jgi:uncharacterized protein YdaU (DUF1376 family)
MDKPEKKTDTWMPLYVTDYLGDTMHLTTEQHGAYMLLLMACWKGDGRIPNDDGRLAAITRLPANRWRACRITLLKFFEIADDFITHKRVVKERARAKALSEKRSEVGKKGVEAKASKRQAIASANGEANDKQTGQQTPQQTATPSPSPLRASVANATGADAPDPIWGTGLAFLKRKGVPEVQARRFLGKLRQRAGDVDIAAALADAEAQDISDPIPWLSRVAVNARAGPAAPSKTLGAIQQLEAMKHGLAGNRDSDRIPETALLGFGADSGD